MSGDKLVLDLATQTTAPPVVFVKKDWVDLMDNQNGQYGNNQSVIDTSQVANSDKFLNYQEAYLTVPMLLTVTSDAVTNLLPATTGCDYAVGLKNWFGQIIHSITVDYNSTNIIQQTPYINFWNHFKLMTTLSWQEVLQQGPTIGFYPDEALTFEYHSVAGASLAGHGVCNNSNLLTNVGAPVSAVFTSPNTLKSGGGNYGFLKRQTYINYNPAGLAGSGAFSTLQNVAASNQLWKSHVISRTNSATGGAQGVYQIAINGIIYLRHLHSFFEMIPLVKGAFMNMTMLLNNTSASLEMAIDAVGPPAVNANMTLTSVTSAYSATCPFMVASRVATNGGAVINAAGNIHVNLSVGARCLDNTMAGVPGVVESPLGQRSIFLHVPAYTFDAVALRAYLTNSIKTINYTDIYHYPVHNVPANGNFNQLITNGIADLKSILIIPFLSTNNPGFNYAQFSSPFDSAPATTGPLVQFSNFNVQVSGSNMLYNMQQYSFEEFCNQLHGSRSVNNGLTDGLSSGLVNFQDFQHLYCYYYVDISRMRAEDKQIARSVQIQGINRSNLNVDLHVFVEYGKEMKVNVFDGSRVA